MSFHYKGQQDYELRKKAKSRFLSCHFKEGCGGRITDLITGESVRDILYLILINLIYRNCTCNTRMAIVQLSDSDIIIYNSEGLPVTCLVA